MGTISRMARAFWWLPKTRRLALVVLALVGVCSLAFGCGLSGETGRAAHRPNIVLILTDDLDMDLLQRHGRSYPNIQKLAADGTTFENAFVTDPLCCPSRATTLRGQYAQNHRILGNWPPLGGAEIFRELGREESTAATWLQEEGYKTALVGKYMNDYHGSRVPAGWDDWYGISGGHRSQDLNENGRIRHYDPGDFHLDDVLAEKAAGYVGSPPGSGSPFFLWVGTQAPHAPADPASRHEEAFPDARLPRSPSFDEGDVSDKPDWVRDNPRLGEVSSMQALYRDRLRSMLAVDEMVGRLMGALRESGELDDTYVFFTSDNGWHAGEHRLTTGKWTAYEEDVRVPLVVSGPGVPEGKTLPHMVLNNDLAPTFADLADADAPDFVDGRSLAPLLGEDPSPVDDWRSAFLVEGATELGPGSVPPLSGDPLPDFWRRVPREEYWGRPGFEAVRTEDRIYVEYGDGERELYDLQRDPHQLDNRYETADTGLLRSLRGRLAALRGCSGPGCRAAEAGPDAASGGPSTPAGDVHR